jgi:hypothetical protein
LGSWDSTETYPVFAHWTCCVAVSAAIPPRRQSDAAALECLRTVDECERVFAGDAAPSSGPLAGQRPIAVKGTTRTGNLSIYELAQSLLSVSSASASCKEAMKIGDWCTRSKTRSVATRTRFQLVHSMLFLTNVENVETW